MGKRACGIALATALIATAIPPAKAGIFGKSTPEPIVLGAGAEQGMSNAFKPITRSPGLPAGARVTVGNFRVVVISEAVGRGTTAPGFGNPDRSTASITAHYSLADLDPVALQSMTDRALASFEAALSASGYQVLPASTLRGSAGAERLAEKVPLAHVQLVGLNGGDSVGWMATPSTLPVKLPFAAVAKNPNGSDIAGSLAAGAQVAQVAAASGLAGKAGGMLGKFGGLATQALSVGKAAQGMGATFGAMGDATAMSEIARGLDAHILDVTYVLTFADIKGSSGGGFMTRMAGNQTASVSASFRPALVPDGTRIQVYSPGAGRALALDRPLIMEGPALGEVRKTTTGKDVAGNVAGAVLSGMIALGTGGSMSTHQTLRREVSATPEYGNVVARNLEQVNRAAAAALGR